jgi:hypothetical protein
MAASNSISSPPLQASNILGRLLFQDHYAAVCDGPVPRTDWPAEAGVAAWMLYDNLQLLCVGDPVFFFTPSIFQSLYPPSFWCRCPYDAPDGDSSRMICTSPYSLESAQQTALLLADCFRHCTCSQGAPPPSLPEKENPPAASLLSSPSRRKKANRKLEKANRQAARITNGQGQNRKVPASNRASSSGIRNCPIVQTCSSFLGCSTERLIAGCESLVCKVSEASPGRFFHFGSCVTPLMSDLNIGGRSLSWDACPCNQSFVSTACCTAPDGLVFEVGGKLGELEEETPSAVIDAI